VVPPWPGLELPEGQDLPPGPGLELPDGQGSLLGLGLELPEGQDLPPRPGLELCRQELCPPNQHVYTQESLLEQGLLQQLL
jgi:hypothetical protein